MRQIISKTVPFICWFKNYDIGKWKANFIGDLAIALVLVSPTEAVQDDPRFESGLS